VNDQSRLQRLLERIPLFGVFSASRRPRESEAVRQSRWRLLVLLILFDVLLIVAVLLSFQGTELIEEEITLEETREVYDVEIRTLIITNTQVITKIVPYGYKE